ncbi:MAG: hypothetical protein AAGU19_00395 [Prolixibacteraceae bacterium]
MKTINLKKGNKSLRYGKIILRSGAVIVSVVLLSFTVSAQGLWKQLLTYNSFGKTAILMVGSSEAGTQAKMVEAERKSAAPSKMKAFYVEPAADKVLAVESWMTDDAYFGAYNHILEVEQDKPLELESWMTDDDYFSSRYTRVPDEDLKLEPWMTDDRYWRY